MLMLTASPTAQRIVIDRQNESTPVSVFRVADDFVSITIAPCAVLPWLHNGIPNADEPNALLVPAGVHAPVPVNAISTSVSDCVRIEVVMFLIRAAPLICWSALSSP